MKSIIFDLDGTLLDTLEDIASCMNDTLRSFGYPGHDPDLYRHFVGAGSASLAHSVLPPGVPEKRCGEVLAAFMEIYPFRQFDKTRVYDGIPELLASLASLKVPVSILSNKPHSALTPVVEHYFADTEFAFAFGAEDGYPKKPDPLRALEIASKLGIRPADIIFTGDSGIDMETGVRAGMRSIGVLWGFRGRDELISSGALAVAEHPMELLRHFEA